MTVKTLKVGSLVTTTEHKIGSIGEVMRINESGDLTIEFRTPRSATLPYGCINTEFWPVSDHHLLTLIETN